MTKTKGQIEEERRIKRKILEIETNIYNLLKRPGSRDKLMHRVYSLGKDIAKYYTEDFNDDEIAMTLDEAIYGPGQKSFLEFCRRNRLLGTVMKAVKNYERGLIGRIEEEDIKINGSVDFFKNQIYNLITTDRNVIMERRNKLLEAKRRIDNNYNNTRHELRNLNKLMRKHPDYFPEEE